METIKIRLSGNAMLQHNGDLANPFNPYAQEIGRLVIEKRGKKGGDKLKILEQIAHTEFDGGLYYDDDTGVHVPAAVVRASLVKGAKLTRGGTTVQRGVQMVGAKFPLHYDGDEAMTKEDLYADKRFVTNMMVVIARVRVPRCRPLFTNWYFDAEFAYNPEVCKRDNLIKYLTDAGLFEGIGDNRTNGYGRFTVKVMACSEGVPEDAAALAAK